MTAEHWVKSHLREIPRSECLELLAAHKVGRIAFVDDDGPLMIPVNYALDGDAVLVATSAFSNLAQSATGSRVAFEVDEVEDYTESGWSVLVRGAAEHVSYDELPHDVARPYPWVEGTRTFVLKITPREITGRRLVPA